MYFCTTCKDNSMIQSMTGFGKEIISLPHKKITIELKSLNSKKLDLYLNLPPEYSEKELYLRKLISEKLGRGKVNLSFYIENTNGKTATIINHQVVRHYMEDLKKVSGSDLHSELELLKMAISLPDALTNRKEEVDDQEFAAIEEGLLQGLKSLNQYRTDEGKALEQDFELRIKNLSALLESVKEMDPERLDKTKQRLQNAVSDLSAAVDENRFEQELVYYIEKYDITEETTRLANHLAYFSETLSAPESNGKKLNFISQEMGREINTIGSKSNYAPMQKLVVQMKDELGKIKEQILNVL